jgi:BMFP domain-containing protein YqiC
MQKDNKFFDDLARMASGAAGSLAEAKREMDAMISHKVELWLSKMNLVTREEFDAMQGMLAKSREEQEKLKERLAALEARLGQK